MLFWDNFFTMVYHTKEKEIPHKTIVKNHAFTMINRS